MVSLDVSLKPIQSASGPVASRKLAVIPRSLFRAFVGVRMTEQIFHLLKVQSAASDKTTMYVPEVFNVISNINN